MAKPKEAEKLLPFQYIEGIKNKLEEYSSKIEETKAEIFARQQKDSGRLQKIKDQQQEYAVKLQDTLERELKEINNFDQTEGGFLSTLCPLATYVSNELAAEKKSFPLPWQVLEPSQTGLFLAQKIDDYQQYTEHLGKFYPISPALQRKYFLMDTGAVVTLYEQYNYEDQKHANPNFDEPLFSFYENEVAFPDFIKKRYPKWWSSHGRIMREIMKAGGDAPDLQFYLQVADSLMQFHRNEGEIKRSRGDEFRRIDQLIVRNLSGGYSIDNLRFLIGQESEKIEEEIIKLTKEKERTARAKVRKRLGIERVVTKEE